MSVVRWLDVTLWRLPRAARKAVVLPIAVGLAVYSFGSEGWGHAVPAARNAWCSVLAHVEDRPTKDNA